MAQNRKVTRQELDTYFQDAYGRAFDNISKAKAVTPGEVIPFGPTMKVRGAARPRRMSVRTPKYLALVEPGRPIYLRPPDIPVFDPPRRPINKAG